ncbi:centrosomal protein POC5 isoform X2 [Hippocampus comes]|nr:PREDICTED: centrosomal protein POC5 isoform X2 [Hippocampus comes]XP_019722558.1 PREDICTED: centrosomal protein POC5 isoform X2 [Hippocampus comes]XP_019722559.1 PREDICTED: centrosomal protein POC5 isoform X2 [Hippocampus comes]XP_019722560.1 PREDICTED: centrosomal protein POC5 isoform X2 [Hippocampus comes]
MSSDEEASVPVLPTESTYRSNSACTELHDEYEELLQSAVASPRFEAAAVAGLVGRDVSRLSSEDHNSQINLLVAEKTRKTTTRGLESSDRLQDASESVQPNDQGFTGYTEVELFISDENISKMENILDTWTQKLKTNVLRELRKWRVAFVDQHRREMQREREIHLGQNEALKTELDSLKELLHTYETSNKRKDEMIRNLSVVLSRQKQKLEKMRAFTQWRLQYSEAKEEAHACQIARQHFHLRLKRKALLAWHSLTQKEWKDRMEQACRAKAEEVCTHLSENYEAQIQTMISEHNEALEKSQAEIERLQLERERREVCMRKALMRGVCALNMETLHLFNPTDGEPQDPGEYDPNSPPDDDPDGSELAQVQPRPARSPAHFDRARSPPHHEDSGNRMGFGAPRSHTEFPPATSAAHTAAGHAAAKVAAGRHPAPRHASAGHSAPGHAAPGYATPVHAAPGHAAPGHSAPGHTAPGHAASGQAGSGYSAPGHAASGHAGSGYSAPGHAASGYAAPGHAAPGHSLFPHGAGPGFHKQASGGVVIASQQKPTKSLTARSSTQHVGKSVRSNLDSVSVAAPMSSTAVDYHHPMTQQTLGQATASKFPRSSQQAPCATGGWALSRMHTSTYSPPPWDEPGSATLAQGPVGSPVHFDHPESPDPHEDDSRMGVWYTGEVLPATSAAHSSVPQGGSTGFHKQVSGRTVTAGQQKPSKTITARITTQPFAGKSVRSKLQVMGMTPPMTSIVVERHQPIAQHTIGHPFATKSVRASQQGPRTPTVVKTSSRTNTCNVQSIKVVD